MGGAGIIPAPFHVTKGDGADEANALYVTYIKIRKIECRPGCGVH